MGNRAPSGRAERVIPTFTATYVPDSRGVSCVPESVTRGARQESGKSSLGGYIESRTYACAAPHLPRQHLVSRCPNPNSGPLASVSSVPRSNGHSCRALANRELPQVVIPSALTVPRASHQGAEWHSQQARVGGAWTTARAEDMATYSILHRTSPVDVTDS